MPFYTTKKKAQKKTINNLEWKEGKNNIFKFAKELKNEDQDGINKTKAYHTGISSLYPMYPSLCLETLGLRPQLLKIGINGQQVTNQHTTAKQKGHSSTTPLMEVNSIKNGKEDRRPDSWKQYVNTIIDNSIYILF